MVGRARAFDIDVATEVAMNLFWGRGYEATSLQDLISATQLSKSSFYQAFGSKHALFRRCLQHYERDLIASLNDMFEAAPSGIGFIESVLMSIADETRGPLARRGCLIMNTATEFAQSDLEIAKNINSSKKRLHSIYRVAIERAQREQDISKRLDPEILADYLLTCTSGLKTMVKAGYSKRSIAKINSVILDSLKKQV